MASPPRSPIPRDRRPAAVTRSWSCDNGSRDGTAQVARDAGATVVVAARRGYGSACLAGLAHLRDRAAGPPDIVVFVDADGSG